MSLTCLIFRLFGLLLTSSIVLATSQVAFAPQTTYPVGSFPRGVALGDLNNDGKPDAVVANSNNGGGSTVSVLLNNGTGGYRPQQTYSVGDTPWGVAVGDFNTDGKVDIVVSLFGTGGSGTSVVVLLGNGTGGFASSVPYGVGSGPYSVAVADFNRDNKPDLVAANNNANSVSVLLNNGSGSFFAQVSHPVHPGPVGVATGDVNGDGAPDIVTANLAANSVSVLLNSGTGTFGAFQNYSVGLAPYYVAVGDLNGDGKADVVATNNGNGSPSNTVSVLISQGGGLAPQVAYLVGSNPAGVSLGDFNNDGHLDIVTADQGTSILSLLVNLGNGTFATSLSYTVGNSPYGVAVGDLNADGKVDIVTTDANDNNVSALINTSPLPSPTTATTVASTIPTIASITSPTSLSTGVTSGTAGTTSATTDAGGNTIISTTSPSSLTSAGSSPSNGPANSGPGKGISPAVLGGAIGGGVGGILVIAGIVVLVIFCYRRRKRSVRGDLELASSAKPSDARKLTTALDVVPGKVDLGRLLGQGVAGKVYEGFWNGTRVALKQLNSGVDLDTEARTMKEVRHPNCVQFFGVYFCRGDMYLLMEFCSKGSLLSFLRTERPHYTTLVQFSRQIAGGLQYLHSMRIIHRDLAARNVLVDERGSGGYVVKVADFGLSKRRLQEAARQTLVPQRAGPDLYYAGSAGELLPVRWTAPEAFEGRHSTASDVWSFGVLLWEEFSYGSLPYPNLHTNQEVIDFVCAGHRMDAPKDCPRDMAYTMSSCWHVDPKRRPTIAQLSQTLEQISSS